MKALITGANGTLGSVLAATVTERGGRVIPWNRQIVAPGDEHGARLFFEKQLPNAVFHTALPSKPTGMYNENWIVNEKWTADLATLAAERDIPFVYISTAMVYTSTITGPYTPDMAPTETEGYGYSKRLGELAALNANPNSRIARIGWQIGSKSGSNNMIDFMVNNQKENGRIDASSKWLPATSFLQDTCEALIQVSTLPPSIYHLDSNSDYTFYEIATALNELHGNEWIVKENEDFVYDQRLLDDRIQLKPLEERLPALRGLRGA